MELLVVSLYVVQDGDALLNVSRFHDDLLEPAVESPVLLDDLGEFVHGGRTDALQLTSGQCRFKHIRRIQAALGPSGSDDSVELVDEEDYVRIGAGLLNDGLKPFFKVATVFRPGDDGGYVQGNQPFLGQDRRDAAAGYSLGYSLDNRGLSDPWLSDQHRVVLLAPSENLDDSRDLNVPSDNRIKLPFGRGFGEVEAEILKVDLPGRVVATLGALLSVGILIGAGCLTLLGFASGLTEKSLVPHVGEKPAVIHAMLPQVGLAVVLCRAA